MHQPRRVWTALVGGSPSAAAAGVGVLVLLQPRMDYGTGQGQASTQAAPTRRLMIRKPKGGGGHTPPIRAQEEDTLVGKGVVEGEDPLAARAAVFMAWLVQRPEQVGRAAGHMWLQKYDDKII